MSDAGETISVDIKSNVEYGVQMPDVDWISDEASSRGMSSHTLNYYIAPNEGYDSRSAEIIFFDKNSDLKDTLKVIQAQKDAIVISEKNISVAKEGGTIEVKVNTNVDFEVQIPSEATWISQTDSRTLTEKNIYLKVAENTSEESRGVEVVFMNKDSQISESITINQAGLVKAGYENGVVTIAAAGTMKELLGDNYLDITSLKVVGPINGDDVYYLRKMLGGYEFDGTWGKLISIDLSEATIVEGGKKYFPYEHHYLCYTSNNKIGPYMFYGCYNLQNITLPDNITSIDDWAFRNCSALTEITIPDGVTSIGDCAFENCSALTEITIPDSVTSIGVCVFGNCSALTEITIPNSVTSISSSAFISCSALTEITIPNGVTLIEGYVFKWCSLLSKVTIGKDVKDIGADAFAYCSINEFYCYASTPPSINTGYYYTFYVALEKGATLYVPAKCGETYKSSKWSRYFKNIVEMD